ncbi:hypothetical protein N9W89_03750 [Hellea sp.]|nr:hypothetical protein [Hellea sp.]
MKPILVYKRYAFTTLGAGLGYLGSVIGTASLHDKVPDGSAVGIFISLIPAIFIGFMLRAFWRYLKDSDEVVRHDLTQAIMAGVFALLMLSGGWGLVELFNDSMPRLPIFYAFPAFFIIFGFVSAINYKRCV